MDGRQISLSPTPSLYFLTVFRAIFYLFVLVLFMLPAHEWYLLYKYLWSFERQELGSSRRLLQVIQASERGRKNQGNEKVLLHQLLFLHGDLPHFAQYINLSFSQF